MQGTLQVVPLMFHLFPSLPSFRLPRPREQTRTALGVCWGSEVQENRIGEPCHEKCYISWALWGRCGGDGTNQTYAPAEVEELKNPIEVPIDYPRGTPVGSYKVT